MSSHKLKGPRSGGREARLLENILSYRLALRFGPAPSSTIAGLYTRTITLERN